MFKFKNFQDLLKKEEKIPAHLIPKSLNGKIPETITIEQYKAFQRELMTSPEARQAAEKDLEKNLTDNQVAEHWTEHNAEEFDKYWRHKIQ